MSRFEHFWPGSEISAIYINAGRCQMLVKGSQSDRLRLEGDAGNRIDRDLMVDSDGGWLVIDCSGLHADPHLNLSLPEQTGRTVVFSCTRGELIIQNVTGCFQAMIGRGSFKMEKCSGQASVMAGWADISIKGFRQEVVAAAPPIPARFEAYSAALSAGDPVFEGLGWLTGHSWRDHFRDWPHHDHRRSAGIPEDWPKGGLDLQVNRGSLNLEDCWFNAGSFKSRYGDLIISRGQGGLLKGEINHGASKIDTAFGGPDWELKTGHGDIRMAIDPAANARLDMATRFGEIRSQLPLVRVKRQGPVSLRSIRMVGTLGDEAGAKSQIRLSTNHGNIEILAQPHPPVAPQPDGGRSINQSSPPAPSGLAPDIATTQSDSAQYRNSLEVLQALSEKKISIEEAEQWLNRLAGGPKA